MSCDSSEIIGNGASINKLDTHDRKAHLRHRIEGALPNMRSEKQQSSNALAQQPDEQIEPIILPDGTSLNERQSLAVYLRVREPDMAHAEIAERTGFAGSGSVCGFLNSRRGQAGVRVAITQHMTEAGRVGFATMLNLAKSAKSENVRQLAAADLLDRAGFARKPWSAGDDEPGDRSHGLQININLGERSEGLLVEGVVATGNPAGARESASKSGPAESAREGGRGKTGDVLLGDPTPSDKTQGSDDAFILPHTGRLTRHDDGE